MACGPLVLGPWPAASGIQQVVNGARFRSFFGSRVVLRPSSPSSSAPRDHGLPRIRWRRPRFVLGPSSRPTTWPAVPWSRRPSAATGPWHRTAASRRQRPAAYTATGHGSWRPQRTSPANPGMGRRPCGMGGPGGAIGGGRTGSLDRGCCTRPLALVGCSGPWTGAGGWCTGFLGRVAVGPRLRRRARGCTGHTWCCTGPLVAGCCSWTAAPGRPALRRPASHRAWSPSEGGRQGAARA